MNFGILSQSSLRGPRVCRGGRSNPGFSAYLLLFTSLLSPALVFATPQVPRTIVFQGILVDAGGNPLTDVPSANANISIVDGAGETRYEEQQNITIYQGATAFLVGMGINPDTGELTGGIPLDVMEPGEGDLILKIKIEGQTISQEDIVFASVPFSFYSHYATELTQPIEASQIKDGAITVSHLSEEVTTYVKSLGVSKEELEEHKTEEAAHAATSISVRNTFKNLTGTDLQMLMESVDYGLTLANKGSEYLEETLASDIADAITTHEAKDMATAHPNGSLPADRISGTINSSQIADGAITSEKIADGSITSSDIKDGVIAAADIDMSIFTGWDTNASDDLTSSTTFSGDISGKYNNLQIKSGAVTTSEIANGAVTSAKLAEDYLKTSGGTLDGDLKVNGNISTTKNIKIDGQLLFSDLTKVIYTNYQQFKITTEGRTTYCTRDWAGDGEDDGAYWCNVSVSCDEGDVLTGCNGYYNILCFPGSTSDECDLMGIYPTDEQGGDGVFDTCNVLVGEDLPDPDEVSPGVTQAIGVYATCLNVTQD